MPRVSVCVSVLNQPELLQNTLESVRAQTFTDWECIIVDDGSNVPIEPIVPKDERFIYHRFEQNKGIPHGANYAYKIARGEFVQPLACDEIIAPTKFADQVAYFDEHPEIDCIWGVPGNGPMGPVPEWEQYSRAAHNRSREHWIKCFINLEGIPIGGASALWRTKVFDSIGYFDPTLTAFSDHEWFCRFFEKHQGIILPYRWMNEIPGHKTISTRTPANGAKMDAELQYVRYKHPLITPQTDGLITIAVPVYNHAKFVGAALESVFAQTDKNFDVIVMDDGSTDDLKTALKPYWDRITYFRSEENCGHMATVNKMLNLAKGDFFVSFSADDTMSPDFLEKCRKEFKADPFYEMVASQNDFLKEDGSPWEGEHPFLTIPKATNRTREEWHAQFRAGNIYFGIGMYRTSALREVGGWHDHGVISDYEMYLRLLPRYNLRLIEEPLTHTRIHGENQSLLNPEEAKKLKRRYFNAQRPYYQPKPKIVIATPFYELKGFSPYISSMLGTTKLLTLHGIDWVFMDLSGDSYVHRARNSMCMNFLDDPWATDLFFIDSDMAWDPNSFVHMVFRPEPIIGGTYPVKNKWDAWTSKPIIFDPEKDPHYMGHQMPEGGALIQASQLAGGFLRIKRSVLEKYQEYYPTVYRDTHPIPEMQKNQFEFFTAGLSREPEINLLKDLEQLIGVGPVDLEPFKPRFEALKQPRDFVGEDYAFSNRLREMGVDLFIYPNATISHFGVNAWTGNFDTYLRDRDKERMEVLQKEKIAAGEVH